MKYAALLLCLILLAPTAQAKEIAPEDLAFVEVDVEPIAAYVGQPVTVTLRVGYDEVHFAKNAVPLFRQEMDVPLQVRPPWADLGDGVEPLALPQPEGPTERFALGDAVVAARRVDDVVRGSRVYRVLEIVRRFVPLQPGGFSLAQPVLRFAYATRFEQDFLGDRTALDARTITVRGALPAVTVGTPPESGRPADWAGAVGRLEVEASVDRTQVRVGERFALSLRLRGEGLGSPFAPPRLEDREGFHVFGVTDERRPGVRTLRYDVAAVRPVDAVPAIRVPTFVPGPPPRYEVAASEPIPLTVRGGASPRDRRPAPPASEADGRFPWGILVAGAILLALALLLGPILGHLLPATPGPSPEGPGPVRAVEPGPRVTSELAELVRAVAAGEELAGPFASVLAARTGLPPAAAIRSDLPGQMAAAGVPEVLAARADACLRALVAARYGATEPAPEAVEVLEIARLLAEPRQFAPESDGLG